MEEFTNSKAPVKVAKVIQRVRKPKPKPPRIITHSCFERVSAQEAERKLSTQPNGSYIIRPTTADPEKLSITWKIYDNIYRHFHVLEIGLEPGVEIGHRLYVENEQKVYETLDELLVAYIQDTSYFINELISYQKFRSTEGQLNEFLETCLQNIPERTAYGFYMDYAKPGCFICGYKFVPGTQMLKMCGIFRPYGFRLKDSDSRFYNINELLSGFKNISIENYNRSQQQHTINH